MKITPHPSDHRIKLRSYSTRRSWVVRVNMPGGKQELVTLRAAPNDDAGALVEGREAIRLAKQGISPSASRSTQEAEERAKHDRMARKGITLGAAVAALLESPELADVRPPTRADLVWALNSPNVKALHGRRLADITRADIESIGKVYVKQGKGATWRKIAGALKRLGSYAASHDWIEKGPAQGMKLPKPKTRAEPFIVTGERPDWSLLVATLAAIEEYEQSCIAKGHASQYGDLWRAQMLTGLRPEAVERLEERDFHYGKKPTLTIRAEVSKLKRELVVPVSGACAEILRRGIHSKPDLFTERQRESALIFPGRNGGPLSKNEPAVAFIDAKVGRGHYRPQRWRDTFISWCEWRGVSYTQIARLVDWQPQGRMGHYSEQGVSQEDRAVVERWATEIELAGVATSNVLPVRRAGRAA